MGTRIMLARLCGGASGSVTTMAIATRRAVVARGEPLVAVDHPLVAVELARATQARRVGARGLRLGHREAGADVAVEQRLEPALLLLLGAVLGEDLHVAGVGRRAVEDHRRDAAAAHQLAEHPVLPVGQPGAESSSGRNRFQSPSRLRALAQLDQDLGVGTPGRTSLSSASIASRSDRIHVLRHELADAIKELGHSVRRCEIHGRGAYRASGTWRDRIAYDATGPTILTAVLRAGADLTPWMSRRAGWRPSPPPRAHAPAAPDPEAGSPGGGRWRAASRPRWLRGLRAAIRVRARRGSPRRGSPANVRRGRRARCSDRPDRAERALRCNLVSRWWRTTA